MSEPDFLRQLGDPMTPEEFHAWLRSASTEMRKNGATHLRVSAHPEIEHLRLLEGWKVTPKDQGEPRWQLTTTR
jgi:hypothetical protein